MSGSRVTDLIASAIVGGLGLWVWFFSRGFPSMRDGHPGPALFPGILAGLLVLTGIALAVVTLRRGAAGGPSAFTIDRAWLHLGEVVVIVAAALAYPILYQYVGFLPTAMVLIFTVAIVLRARWYVAAAVSAAAATLIFFAFTRLLGVPL